MTDMERSAGYYISGVYHENGFISARFIHGIPAKKQDNPLFPHLFLRDKAFLVHTFDEGEAALAVVLDPRTCLLVKGDQPRIEHLPFND